MLDHLALLRQDLTKAKSDLLEWKKSYSELYTKQAFLRQDFKAKAKSNLEKIPAFIRWFFIYEEST